MVGCSVPNCSGNTRKGDKLYRFPKEENRRHIWIINVRRRNWEPTDHSRICEHHFETSQFEAEGCSKKLRRDAIPTKFKGYKPQKSLQSKRILMKVDNMQKIKKSSGNLANCRDHSYAKGRKVKKGKRQSMVEVNDETIVNDANEQPNVNEERNVVNNEPETNCSNCKHLKLEIRSLKRQLKNTQSKMERLEGNFNKLFRSDQLEMMKNKSGRPVQWSQETLNNAVQIRHAAGVKGYNFLRQLTFPLPSYRTISRHLLQTIQHDPAKKPCIVLYVTQ